VRNRRGVHGRVATALAEIARSQGVKLEIVREGRAIDCLSILDVLSQGFVCGTRLVFRARGQKADKALQVVEELLSQVEDTGNGTKQQST